MQYKVGIVQVEIYPTKAETLKNVQPLILSAIQQGAKLVVLGECFTSYYYKPYLQQNAEDFDNPNNRPAYDFIVDLSKTHKIVIIAGLPEKIGEVYYNTAICVQDGQLLGKYHKIHLFDGNNIGKLQIQESDIFKKGDEITVFDTVCGRIGLGICYDLRFPLLAQALRTKGCQLILYPGGFNPVRGPLHWELLLRARAVDNNVYCIGVSTATYQGDDPNIYQFWGHSMLVNPWGQVLVQAEQKPGVFIGEVDLSENEKLQKQIPTLSQKRQDLYQFQCK